MKSHNLEKRIAFLSFLRNPMCIKHASTSVEIACSFRRNHSKTGIISFEIGWKYKSFILTDTFLKLLTELN